MLKPLSGFDDEKLKYFLARVREIASLGDEAAMIETDKLLWEVVNEEQDTTGIELARVLYEYGRDASEETNAAPVNDDQIHEGYHMRYARQQAQREIQDVTKEMQLISDMLNGSTGIDYWAGERLSRHVDGLGSYWEEPIVDEYKSDLKRIKEDAYKLIDKLDQEAERQTHLRNVDDLVTSPIYNSASVQSMLVRLDDASQFFLKHHELTNELSDKIRKGKDRAAWYRAKKKLSEAEVARAGGSNKKATKLRGEAIAVLTQDWERAFPGETPPQIATND